METVAAVSGIVGGGLILTMGSLVCFAKYITDKLNEENERKINDICNNLADKIESDIANKGSDVAPELSDSTAPAA